MKYIFVLLILVGVVTAEGEEAIPELVQPIGLLPVQKPDMVHVQNILEICQEKIKSHMSNPTEVPGITVLFNGDSYLFRWENNINTTDIHDEKTTISAVCEVKKESGNITKLSIDGIQVI